MPPHLHLAFLALATLFPFMLSLFLLLIPLPFSLTFFTIGASFRRVLLLFLLFPPLFCQFLFTYIIESRLPTNVCNLLVIFLSVCVVDLYNDIGLTHTAVNFTVLGQIYLFYPS